MIMTTQFVFSLVIALSVSLILSTFLRKQAPRAGFFFFFLMLFLITLAGGLWIKPFGPTIYGVFWVPLLIIGLFAGLFLYHSTPDRLPRNRQERMQRRQDQRETRQLEQLTYVTLDVFFWIIIFLLIISILYQVMLSR